MNLLKESRITWEVVLVMKSNDIIINSTHIVFNHFQQVDKMMWRIVREFPNALLHVLLITNIMLRWYTIGSFIEHWQCQGFYFITESSIYTVGTGYSKTELTYTWNRWQE